MEFLSIYQKNKDCSVQSFKTRCSMGVTTRNHNAKVKIKTLGTKKSKKLFAMSEINDNEDMVK